MKFKFCIFSFILSLSLIAIEFKVSNALKEPVTLSFDIYSDTGELIPNRIKDQSYTIESGKTKIIKPDLILNGQIFNISTIFVKNKNTVGYSSYYIDENMRNKNLLLKLVLGKTIQLTAKGPREVPGPVFDVVQVMK